MNGVKGQGRGGRREIREDFLSIKLFRRRNRSLLLTEEGQSYFLDIKDIFVSIIDATDRVLEKNEKGALTISLPPSFAIQWLVPRLIDFNRQEPSIDVRIKAVDMNENSCRTQCFLGDD